MDIMINYRKLFAEIETKKDQLFSTETIADKQKIYDLWQRMLVDPVVSQKIKERRYGVLVPWWNGLLGEKQKIERWMDPYTIVGVDGSQIYYDKHQGPPCYVINVGEVVLRYGSEESSVLLSNQPHLKIHEKKDGISTQHVDMEREEYELKYGVDRALLERHHNTPLLLCMDGSLIFFQIDMLTSEEGMAQLDRYLQYLEKSYQEKIPLIAYMSFPKTKELVHALTLYAVNFDESLLHSMSEYNGLTDADLVELFLQPGERTVVFASKAPVTYVYPAHLKPHFCYMHVGWELVRIEFPAWIAEDLALVDHICQLLFDQVIKGSGYPVVLFEAHEQAVVSAAERALFYDMLEDFGIKHAYRYQKSYKSMKKRIVPI